MAGPRQVTIIFESPTTSGDEITKDLAAHGDFVKDVAFAVQDLDELVRRAKEGGAEIVKGITEEKDKHGSVRYAVLKTYGDNTHTLIDRSNYKGTLLPGYEPVEDDVLNTNLFWCVDYKHDLVPYSCINSASVINRDETVLLSMNEAAKGLRPTSKATEFVKSLGTSGVEHVALYTDDIVSTMRSLKARGAEIVTWPATYYELIREKLKHSSVRVAESLEALQQYHILIDFDERGYMLQAFTKHVQARPTVFIEILQRRNHRYGDNTHTLIDRSNYKGTLLPGYEPVEDDVLNTNLPETNILFIDHVEGNMADGTLEDSVAWYEKNLNMQRFWCVDYKHDLVPYSCINSASVINRDETVLLSMNEAAKGLRPTSKATEFVKSLGTSGVEHVALYTDDIVSTMRSLKARGAEIVTWPATYYELIREKLKHSSVRVAESLEALQQHHILIDFDERGYMLQAFTKHVQARPTVFIEILQRRNHRGFGAMNYKWVFEAIERLDASQQNQPVHTDEANKNDAA